jgi:hypothetical protein
VEEEEEIIFPLENTKGRLHSCITPSIIFQLNRGHRVMHNIRMWLQNHIGRSWRLGKSGFSPKFEVTYLNQLMKFFRINVEMYRKSHLYVPPRLPQYIRNHSPSSYISSIAFVSTYVATFAGKTHLYATIFH